MKRKLASFAPAAIVAGTIGSICLLLIAEEWLGAFGMLRRLEWITYDWRARQAAQRPTQAATNLGFVFISDETIEAVRNGTLDYRSGLYWPRHVYGRLVSELATQGAQAVGFDVLFPDLRPDHPTNDVPGGIPSDIFFAREIARGGNVILAAAKGTVPPDLFRTSAFALGDISTLKDTDGVLRRVRPFETYYLWDKLIKRAAERYNFDLRRPRFEARRISFPIAGGSSSEPAPERIFELDPEGNFDWVQLFEEISGEKVKGLVRPFRKPYETIRVWDMGLAVAARHLHLDLSKAVISSREIILQGPAIKRVIPLDADGRFSIDWSITPYDSRLTRESLESLLLQDQTRRSLDASLVTNRWKDKLAFVGSVASAGNDLTDLGATPLEKETYLTSRFWNTANSLITGEFIRPTPLVGQLVLICALGLLARFISRERFRTGTAVLGVIVSAAIYLLIVRQLFLSFRIWLPLVAPIASLLLTHFGLIAYRAFAEGNERRRIKQIFARIVSPEVVNELLKAENLSLVGARRKVTVSFADVRQFTEITDLSQAFAEEYVRQQGIEDRAAEEYFDAQSRDLLATVNLYLGMMADVIKKHNGTLDKYIGDCVMAFWGAPAPNEKNATDCVRAAIEAQRAIYALNEARGKENHLRAEQNALRVPLGDKPLPILKMLSVGMGINTGLVTAGLMGSEDHIYNYTVFGRDINIASRLEGRAGGGQILIGESTYFELLHDSAELAATCVELDSVLVRGISTPIKIFEVRWLPDLSMPSSILQFDLEAAALSSIPERKAS